jgi:hypothetical protein
MSKLQCLTCFTATSRYHQQEFFDIKREHYKNLARMQWCSKAELDKHLRDIALGQRTAIIPHLVQGFLRVKVVREENEIAALLCKNLETTMSPCKRLLYFFGYEPRQLQHKDALGFLVSSWELNELSTEVELTYEFLVDTILIFRKGFGRRGGVYNAALNVYFKMFGRGSTRPHPSGAVAEEEVGAQQYYNRDYGNDLTSPFVRKVIHDLLQGVYKVAQRHNPELMELVNDTCCRGILTTGHIPKATHTQAIRVGANSIAHWSRSTKKKKGPMKGSRKKVKHSNTAANQSGPPVLCINTSQEPESDSDTSLECEVKEDCPPSNTFTRISRPAMRSMSFAAPPIGFFNTSHLDRIDQLTAEQRKSWVQISKTKKWSYCLKILHAQNDMFCLPTTCAYQFVFRTESAKFDLHPVAFFSMEGLGMAMELQHGLTHHFMGAAFSHHTCIPLCRRRSDGAINTTNSDNNVLIMAWGSNGGVREVRERQRRQEAPSLNAANARIGVLEAQLREAGLTPASAGPGDAGQVFISLAGC